MSPVDPPDAGPPLSALSGVFRVYETRQVDDRLVYYGEPLAPQEAIMERVWPRFRDHGYEVTLTRQTGEHVLVAEPVEVGVSGIPWTNIVLLLATVLSTLYAGTMWYYVREPLADPVGTVLTVWPFAVAVLGVLGVHELGHYVMSRHHEVDATLPYFIPMPTIIGTMGAVIRMRGQMPDRRALFDIGVAGPLAGLAATVVVTAIGLSLEPIAVPQWVLDSPNTMQVQFGYPPLFQAIAFLMGQPIGYSDPSLAVNPVVFGGWVGMFVTFLNLLPVGQLDGGHIVRAIAGKRQATVAAIVPAVLFGLAGYLFYVRDVGSAVGLWAFWGLLALVFAFAGSANPIQDQPLDTRRKLVGLATFGLGLLCFTPVPIQVIM
ncbi:MAG: site-2 protease family protein [Halobacteriales archaeon]|nr:site-2 protease family protein [Halobacteriales archaeon]